MKVLLITSNLYKAIGGGQTVYKKIVESTPEVEFYYFITDEPIDAERPSNAQPIRLKGRRSLRALVPPPFPTYQLRCLEEADQYARTIAGQTFDIVDVPDYHTFGSCLRDAFAHHHVDVGRVVLALHGNISKSIELNWDSAGNNTLELRMLELAQFKSADAIYGISPRYIKEWQSQFSRDVTYVDPSYFVDASINNSTSKLGSGKPSLYCIGRSERRKGNDLFVELVSWLNKDSFEKASHVGELDFSYRGIPSSSLLGNIAKQRGIDVQYLSAMNRTEMQNLYSEKSVVILPVRYDTLNLVVMESLFSGCPVAISESAGVCDYLDQCHPGLPYIKIDFGNFYDAAGKLQNLVDNYDHHRAELVNYLAVNSPVPKSPLQFGVIYQKFLDASLSQYLDKTPARLCYEESGHSFKERATHLARKLLPMQAYQSLRGFMAAPKSYLIEKIKKSGRLSDAKYFEMLVDATAVPWRLKRIAGHSEYNSLNLRKKLDKIYGNAISPLFRCNFWKDIARIERILGNELIAVTYEIRILRLLGDDRLGLLPGVLETLKKFGFHHEAEAAQAMYGDLNQATEHVYSYLTDAYQRNLVRQDKPWEILEDNRSSSPAKVAVIVSLYNAADKLKLFLTTLFQQTLLKQSSVEIILVDSGSPTNEHEVVTEFIEKTPLNVVYARSIERETIQAAWNRGIGLAKSPYLVFLGVDETLYPEALEILANELDKNSDVDWVMANSLVTAVEENGVYKQDIMPYNREGASKDHTYLETCYLSWVGGMYRSSIHTRFGYYDETFGAAGDTEFKNRILPHIKVKFIPKVLGLFLNYPDGQTTASPKAEIEDLRAWYVHRTLGGLRYAFENRSIEDAEAQLCRALGYRKSYCGHMSCDIEYATYLAEYITMKKPGSTTANSLLPGLNEMLDSLRSVEYTPIMPTQLNAIGVLIKAWRIAEKYEAEHRSALHNLSSSTYSILNDNRYEQHSWLWKS